MNRIKLEFLILIFGFFELSSEQQSYRIDAQNEKVVTFTDGHGDQKVLLDFKLAISDFEIRRFKQQCK